MSISEYEFFGVNTSEGNKMTMPHLMNCDHSDEGWCLDCVEKLHDDREYAIYQKLELAEAQKKNVMNVCWELWGSRRAMAYSPSGEKAMLRKHPWLGEVHRPHGEQIDPPIISMDRLEDNA